MTLIMFKAWMLTLPKASFFGTMFKAYYSQLCKKRFLVPCSKHVCELRKKRLFWYNVQSIDVNFVKSVFFSSLIKGGLFFSQERYYTHLPTQTPLRLFFFRVKRIIQAYSMFSRLLHYALLPATPGGGIKKGRGRVLHFSHILGLILQ